MTEDMHMKDNMTMERIRFCLCSWYHLLFALLVICVSLADAELQQQQECEVGDNGLCVNDGARDIATCRDARENCQEWAELGTSFTRCRYNLWSKVHIVQRNG